MAKQKNPINKQSSDHKQTGQMQEPTAADIARKMKAYRKPGPITNRQTPTGTGLSSPGDKRTRGEARSTAKSQGITPNAPTSAPDQDSMDQFDQLQCAVNDVRNDLSGIEDRIVERLKDKAVSEVFKVLIIPMIIAAIFYLGGLFYTYNQAVNGVRAEIDRVISFNIREAQQKNREETDNKIRALDSKLNRRITRPIVTPSAVSE